MDVSGLDLQYSLCARRGQTSSVLHDKCHRDRLIQQSQLNYTTVSITTHSSLKYNTQQYQTQHTAVSNATYSSILTTIYNNSFHVHMGIFKILVWSELTTNSKFFVTVQQKFVLLMYRSYCSHIIMT